MLVSVFDAYVFIVRIVHISLSFLSFLMYLYVYYDPNAERWSTNSWTKH